MESTSQNTQTMSKKAIVGMVFLLFMAIGQLIDHQPVGAVFSFFAALSLYPPFLKNAKTAQGKPFSGKDRAYAAVGTFLLGYAISAVLIPKFMGKYRQFDNQLTHYNSATTATPTLSTKQMAQTNSNTITLDRLAPVLLSFDVKQSNDQYIGYSHDGKSNITLIGSKDDIRTLMLSLNNIKVKNVETYASLLASTLDAVFPTWNARSTWLTTSLRQLSNSTDPDGDSVETDVDNKHILLGYSPLNQGVSLTITVK